MPKSDLKRVDRMKDEDIDYSDIPPLTDAELAGFRPLGEVFPDLVRRPKTRITIRIDDDVLAWFKARAKGGDVPYQALINQALRAQVARDDERVEDVLRRIVREELAKAGR